MFILLSIQSLGMVSFNGGEEGRGRFTGTFPGVEAGYSHVWPNVKSCIDFLGAEDSSVEKPYAVF